MTDRRLYCILFTIFTFAGGLYENRDRRCDRSVLPFALILIWGNSAALVSIVPVVGGALGGLISGIIAVLNLLIVKGVKPIWLKILISIGMLAAAFLLCFLIGSMIVNALTQ